ncbi:MAG: hypothetical protein H0T51_18610 [Pirellulales bacterium]|nr:hypothetical protein [Pirellulales bacterium]
MDNRPANVRRIGKPLCSCVALVAAALSPAFLGCGPKPHVDPNRTTVSGAITFDGAPLKAGSITFDSTQTGIGTTIMIREGGRYITDRVPLGPNIVTIETESLLLGSPGLYIKIPAEYADPSKSGLTVDIKPGVNENVDFALKK